MAVHSLGLVDYVKLGVVVLAAAAMYAAQSIVLAFYYCFPFKGALGASPWRAATAALTTNSASAPDHRFRIWPGKAATGQFFVAFGN